MPPITLHFLQASRSIRIAWLLSELNLDYDVNFADRLPNMKSPEDFKTVTGNPLGKAPALRDGGVTVYESPPMIHAAEATFMLHALAITYFPWNIPSSVSPNIRQQTEAGLSINVQKDLDWLETELSLSTGPWLCGSELTAADIMMQFSIDFIMKTELGTGGRSWPKIEKWLRDCGECGSYRRAMEKTGYELTFKLPEVK
ncbi:hypothetical protein K458DRAFT_445770 [Lentithecium fluviatile CBS 122367]|uniref:GST N-terminal domain-containing protein n=1 Tax=Lentithecium fluviatile CBS 122367 TaxID=1168545 RepID=A0A6G1IMF4_9PLEO|nr:hypothetical protein K458DRAFT_445770 [Lentithecium fluviatile CBS 122367]